MPTLPVIDPPETHVTHGYFDDILDVSLTGIILFRQIYNGDQIIDFAYERLNNSAQMMLNLPEKPSETFLNLYPKTIETGIFAFYRDTFLSGIKARYNVNYSYDGLDNYFHLSAKRSQSLLIVSFTDNSDQDRTEVEKALRESQLRELNTQAQINLERQQSHTILMQAPAMIAIYEGRNHVIKLVNPPFQRLVGNRQIVGLPIAKAMPELGDQAIFELLIDVYLTGETFYAYEMKIMLDHHNTGKLGENYYNFIYQALRDVKNNITGILVFAYEVTAQVKARLEAEEASKKISY